MLNSNQKIFLNSAINLDSWVINYEAEDFEEFYGCNKEEMKEDIRKLIDILDL